MEQHHTATMERERTRGVQTTEQTTVRTSKRENCERKRDYKRRRTRTRTERRNTILKKQPTAMVYGAKQRALTLQYTKQDMRAQNNVFGKHTRPTEDAKNRGSERRQGQ